MGGPNETRSLPLVISILKVWPEVRSEVQKDVPSGSRFRANR
jgi:hypothetical protein